MKEGERKGKAVVVGGSIAGLSCAHALIAAGWEVVVLEKTSSPATGCATGAGFRLDPLALKLISSWLHQQPHTLHLTTMPLTIDQVTKLSFKILDYLILILFSISVFLTDLLKWVTSSCVN